MTKVRLSIVLIIVIVGQVSLAFGRPVQASPYKFAYVALTSTGEGRIISIDPVDKTTSIKRVQMFPSASAPISFYPYPSWVSPSGEWIAVDDVWSATNDTVRLVNTRSGVTRDIGLSILLVISPVQEQGMVWSPNGQYIAFSSPADKNDSAFHAYIYSVSDAKLIRLNVNQILPLRFDWSADSSALMVQGGNDPAADHSVLIDIINVKANTLENQLI